MNPTEYHTIAQVEATHWWYVAMRQIAATLLRQALTGATSARILDAGCGVGGGLQWLTEFGSPVGIDLHPLAVTYAHRVSSQVAQASIQAIPFSEATFAGVTSFDVLYHLNVNNDVVALCEFARVTRPGGWLLLRVPAHEALRGAHDRHVHTRHRYAARELREKIEAAGWRVQRFTPVGALLLPPAMLRRWLQSAAEAHTDVTLPTPLINHWLTVLLAAERHWVARADLPFGLSWLALAHKPNG
jgi:SAM-dependent methyltransferase